MKRKLLYNICIEAFFYANNEPKSALARDLGDCRDNKGKLAKRVFTCLRELVLPGYIFKRNYEFTIYIDYTN